MVIKYTIGDNGFECKDGDSIIVTEIIKGDIKEIKRYKSLLDGREVQHLVVCIRSKNEEIELILKYTSLEARSFMNAMARLNLEEEVCGKNCKIFYLSDINEKGKYRDIRIEKKGKYIRWLYEIPQPEIINGLTDYSERDKFGDMLYEEVKGVWCE